MSVAISHTNENAVGVSVAPPSFGEDCDKSDCPAKPLVAVELMSGRLTFCGHDYDDLPKSIEKLIMGVCDTRTE